MALAVDSREIPKKDEKKTTSVRFREVAVYFSEEEWSQLDPSEKDLYSNVMRDIHKTLLSSGYTILHPDVLCRIRRDREPCMDRLEEDHKGASVPRSDIIFKIKRDEELCVNEGNPTASCSKRASVLTPDIIFRIKHDEEVCFDEEDRQRRSTKSELGFPADAIINEEGRSDGVQKEGQKDVHSNEEVTSETSEAGQLVFNPKLSIWIKQVDEVSEVTPEVLSAACTDGNVTEIKTEIDFTPDCKKSSLPQDLIETASDKNTTLENHQVLEKNPKEEHAGNGEESLLSIVLRRGNTGSLYIPNYKYSSGYKEMACSRGVRGMVEKETLYPPKLAFFQSPNSNALLSSFHAHPAPLQHCAHHVDKPFRCRICNKCFKTLGILNVHMKTHSGVRPYQCNECGKSFRDNWNLKVHQKIHTGETPYRCTICDKGFIQYATYMKHQRVHTGEKPYSCCYCDKRFTNSSNLVRHYRTHTGEKPYVCMECGKSFSYNTSLIQHKRVHKVEAAENGTNDPNNE